MSVMACHLENRTIPKNVLKLFQIWLKTCRQKCYFITTASALRMLGCLFSSESAKVGIDCQNFISDAVKLTWLLLAVMDFCVNNIVSGVDELEWSRAAFWFFPFSRSEHFSTCCQISILLSVPAIRSRPLFTMAGYDDYEFMTPCLLTYCCIVVVELL